MAVTGRALAWLNLARHFGAHVLLRMPRRALGRSRDLERFLGDVAPDGYLPLTPDERDHFTAFMRCIHCGLCSLACPALRAAPASAWDEAWTFVGGPSRSLDSAPLVLAGPGPCSECAECAAVCPTGVPIPRLAALVRRMADAAHDDTSTQDLA